MVLCNLVHNSTGSKPYVLLCKYIFVLYSRISHHVVCRSCHIPCKTEQSSTAACYGVGLLCDLGITGSLQCYCQLTFLSFYVLGSNKGIGNGVFTCLFITRCKLNITIWTPDIVVIGRLCYCWLLNSLALVCGVLLKNCVGYYQRVVLAVGSTHHVLCCTPVPRLAVKSRRASGYYPLVKLYRSRRNKRSSRDIDIILRHFECYLTLCIYRKSLGSRE